MNKLEAINRAQQVLAQKQYKMIEQGLNSTDPAEIIKAQTAFNQLKQQNNFSPPSDLNKSYLIDPDDFYNSFGYKNRRSGMSYDILRGMAKTPIINAIHKTRINQVASFSEAQENKYALGFVIEKKPRFSDGADSSKPTKQEWKEIEFLLDFLENGGQNLVYNHDDFDTFLRKTTKDSLCFDQMCFEVVTDRRGQPQEFYAVDASTIRIAESFDDSEYKEVLARGASSGSIKGQPIKGYFPSYVQIWQQEIKAEFYPWELCFGVRNPTTDVRLNGYGVSELEELVTTVTSLLWGEEYNRRFFKQGSMPKGMFRLSGNVNESRLREFRQFWQSTMQGVWNSWRIPMIQSDQIEYIDLQKTNQEMEFSKWIEFLIKVSCAIYTIDPAEVNFPLSGGADQQSMFEGSNEARLKHSKDKGLAPLLRFKQKRINKMLINPFFNGKYRFRFVGIDALSPKDEQDMDIAGLSNYEMLDEVRTRRGLQPLGEEKGGNIILNPTYYQYLQAQMMNEQGMGDPNMQQPANDEGRDPFADDQEDDPFAKAMGSAMKSLFQS